MSTEKIKLNFKDDYTALNLAERFERVKKHISDLKNLTRVGLEKDQEEQPSLVSAHSNQNKNDILSLKNDIVRNEIFNKLNYYKQLINFQEGLNLEFSIEISNLLRFIDSLLTSIYKKKNLLPMMDSIDRVENMIIKNFDKALYNKQSSENINSINSFFRDDVYDVEDKTEQRIKQENTKFSEEFFKNIDSFFTIYEENLNISQNTEKEKIKLVKNYCHQIINFTKDLFENIKLTENILNSFDSKNSIDIANSNEKNNRLNQNGEKSVNCFEKENNHFKHFINKDKNEYINDIDNEDSEIFTNRKRKRNQDYDYEIFESPEKSQ